MFFKNAANYTNVLSKIYRTSDIIFSLAPHLKSLHIVLQIKH